MSNKSVHVASPQKRRISESLEVVSSEDEKTLLQQTENLLFVQTKSFNKSSKIPVDRALSAREKSEISFLSFREKMLARAESPVNEELIGQDLSQIKNDEQQDCCSDHKVAKQLEGCFIDCEPEPSDMPNLNYEPEPLENFVNERAKLSHSIAKILSHHSKR